MIVANVARGTSFKGVTAYLAGLEGDRPEWTATANIGTENPFMAARVMAATAMDAEAIKRANGWNGKGRKSTDKPVHHWIMSWDESRSPDATHQEQAARDLLKALGFEKAQAVIVGHNDNGKTHAHIVVNLIDPETGKQFSLSNDQRKAQAWALDYCKANGIDTAEIAPNRAKNAEARQQAANDGRPPVDAALDGTKRLTRKEWDEMRAALTARHASERAALQGQHGADWEAAKAALAQARREDAANWKREHRQQKAVAKESYKPHWRDLFKRQRIEQQNADRKIKAALASHRFRRSAIGRLVSVFQPTAAMNAEARLALAQLTKAELIERHERERKSLGKAQSQDAYEATKAAVERTERPDIAAMKSRHDQDRAKQRERHQAERENAGIKSYAKPKAKEQDNREGQAPRPARSRYQFDLSEKARAKLDRAKERDRQARDRGDDHGREM